MNAKLKSVLLIAGLLAAGTLVAQGPGGPGFFGGHGPGYGPGHGSGGQMMGMGYRRGPGRFANVDTDSYLGKLKADLSITESQQQAWAQYASVVKDHSEAGAPCLTGNRGQGRWDQRQTMHDAASQLSASLDAEQRTKAQSLRVPGVWAFN